VGVVADEEKGVEGVSKPETSISRAAQDALARAGFHVTRVHSGKVRVARGWMQLAEKGTPDLSVQITGPVRAWLESKVPGGTLSADQKQWHADAEKRGELVAVFTSAREAVEIACGWRRGFEVKR
jgi:hypothetical protein